MSVLLVGFGYWGKNWGQTLHRMGELGAICEANAGLHDLIHELCPGTPIFERLDDALAHAGVEAAVIATPAPTHYRIAGECLSAGKHVLAEKPMTLSPEEADALVGIARHHQCKLAVGHLLMYHPGLLKLKSLIDSGELGDVLSVQCTRVNLGKIRNEESAWWSLAPHDLSIIALLTGDSFKAVNASQMVLLGRSDIADSVTAQFETASGIPASVNVSWYSPVKKHETVVIGSKRIAIFDDAQPVGTKLVMLDYNLDRADERTVNGIQKGELQAVDYEATNDLLGREAAAFLSACRTGGDLPNDGENGALVVRMLAEVEQMLRQPVGKA